MNWFKKISEALDYIENHLLEEITNKSVSENAFISSFHFQRMFSLVTELTLKEYITKRKLSKAGEELLSSNISVTDLAMKYGYSSSSSFSKAFTRFHGVSPRKARVEKHLLKSFNRLNVKLTLSGGDTLDYTVLDRDSFKLLLKMIPYSGENMPSDILKLSEKLSKYDAFREKGYGIGLSLSSKESPDIYSFGLGQYYSEGDFIPDGFHVVSIPKSKWAVFNCRGSLNEDIDKTWEKIYTEWMQSTSYDISFEYEIEYYKFTNHHSDNCQFELHIPIKEG